MRTRQLLAMVVLCSLSVSVISYGCSSSSENKDIVADGVLDSIEDTPRVDGTVPDLRVEDSNEISDMEVDTVEDTTTEITELVGDTDLEENDQIEDSVFWPEPHTGPGVTFEIQSDKPATPFPWDWYRVPSADTPTGYHISVSGPNQMPMLLAGLFALFSTYLPDMESMDGFGSLGIVLLPMNTAMDPLTLPATTEPGGLLEMLVVPTTGAARSIPAAVYYEEYKNKAGELVTRVVHLAPWEPGLERTEHLVIVRKGLKDAEGRDLEPSPLAEVLLGLREPFGTPSSATRQAELRDRTLAALSRLGPGYEVNDIAAAVLFTTGTMETTLFTAANNQKNEEIQYTLDPDQDGKANITLPGDTPGVGNDPNVGLVIQGEFRCPDFRKDAKTIVPGPDGSVPVQGYRWEPFFILVPANATASMPVAIVQHGLNSWKETMFGLSKGLVAQGTLTAGFDFVHHAKGTDGGFKFVLIDRVAQTTDNFRQSGLDYVMFARTMEKIVEDWDYSYPNGDPIPKPDMSRLFFTGHSLGAIESTVAGALYEGNIALGLANAGGNLQYLLEGKLKDMGLYDMTPGDAMVGLKAVASQVMSMLDPSVFAPYVAGWAPESTSKPYLLMISLQDETVYAECGINLAHSLRSNLMIPFIEEWPGLATSEATGLSSGTVQFDGHHSFLFGQDGPEMEAQGRAVLFHYAQTWFTTGEPEIMWPAP